MDNFGFDELQADAIVKLQLGRLAGLEILKKSSRSWASCARPSPIMRIFLANDSTSSASLRLT